ncbi:hypothetical protein Tco_0482612 [Tanacetum coccineum]
MVSPLNPVRISEDAPPSTYIRCTKCPPISASMIIGPSVRLVSRGCGKSYVVAERNSGYLLLGYRSMVGL